MRPPELLSVKVPVRDASLFCLKMRKFGYYLLILYPQNNYNAQ